MLLHDDKLKYYRCCQRHIVQLTCHANSWLFNHRVDERCALDSGVGYNVEGMNILSQLLVQLVVYILTWKDKLVAF